MAEFVFVNPSPNLELIAKEINAMGRSVAKIFTRGFVNRQPNDIWAFIGSSYTCLSKKRPLIELDSNISNLNKPFFSSFKYRYVQNKLSAMNSNLRGGTFQDYILLSGELWKDETPARQPEETTFEQALLENTDSVIVTSRIPSSSGKHIITRWKTDYDVRETLGHDYYMFFDGYNRHELYCADDLLVSSSNMTSLDWLKLINPTMKRFSFEKVKSMSFLQNTNAWICKYSSNVFLVNDYNWLNFSIRLPEAWVKSVTKMLFTYKKPKGK